MIFFSVVPSGTLTLGSSLNASNIKEGDDVYFECSVRASPAPYKITWRHNGRELSHNVAKKVIISNQSLVLQKVTRADTGVYTCTAHNSEGDGVSNSINLNIKCKPRSSSFFLLYVQFYDGYSTNLSTNQGSALQLTLKRCAVIGWKIKISIVPKDDGVSNSINLNIKCNFTSFNNCNAFSIL